MQPIRVIAGGLVTAILLTNVLALPVGAQPRIPQPPITSPNLLGKPTAPVAEPPAPTVKAPITDPDSLGKPAKASDTATTNAVTASGVQTIKTMTDLQSCLEGGQSAYGVTVQTTNVRSAPSTDACRYGKLAKGTLVEISDYQVIAAEESTETERTETEVLAGPTVGYVEDIQPLFERSCAACHNAAAKTMGLQTTIYAALMAGSLNGPVVVPGDPDASKLWEMVGQGKMPATGPLPAAEQELVREWIAQGAAERRAAAPAAAAAPAGESTWLTLVEPELVAVNDACSEQPLAGKTLASADLIAPLSCGAPPADGEMTSLVAAARPATNSTTTTAATASATTNEAAPQAAASAPAATGASATGTGIEAAAFGLPAPSEADPYLVPAGFCVERRLPDNSRGITAIAFGADGRMFLALDSDLAHEVDPLILYDAYHPSRSIAIYDWANDMTPVEIMAESSRVTGLDYADGTLYVSRAGEVGRIPDGGAYETLAGGFAVSSQLFHANNGILVANGWVYVSAGGVRDGFVEGPIIGVGEAGAQDIVSGGNPFAARIVRAPLDTLLSQKTIGVFSTAARGVRNPYGITADPAGRIWFTDNGATNVPDEINAGDEVNVIEPGSITGDDASSLYYGFPLALSGPVPEWYVDPALNLVNSAAPTGITYAYDTIFFGAYGRNPGVYRLARDGGGNLVGERIMMAWPVLALATGPDGALWVGMGDGGLFRLTPGCN